MFFKNKTSYRKLLVHSELIQLSFCDVRLTKGSPITLNTRSMPALETGIENTYWRSFCKFGTCSFWKNLHHASAVLPATRTDSKTSSRAFTSSCKLYVGLIAVTGCQVNEALKYADGAIKQLMDGLYKLHLHECANIIIVSEQGMSS